MFSGLKSKSRDHDDENDEDEDGGEEGSVASDSPPAFNPDVLSNFIPGITDKPVTLKIKSRPPMQSPYYKEFQAMVDKLKIVPRVVAPAKTNGSKEEEKKGD